MGSTTFRFAALVLSLVLSQAAVRADEKPFELHGTYLEGCSCKMVCTCALRGEMMPGCQVLGAMIITSGSYGKTDLSGVKLAFAIGEEWVRIYVQAADSTVGDAAGAMATAMLSAYGRVESISRAQVDLTGSDGHYSLAVNGGEDFLLKTEPVLGGDGETAVTYTNYPDPLLPTIRQGKTISANYSDDTHHFTLKESNSFFNQDWGVSGKI